MEKKKAHYDLDAIKKLIRNNKYKITNSARVNYLRLGFCDDRALEIVLSLNGKDLHKSMTSYHNNKIWQDVYIKIEENLKIYIKLQIVEEAIIISFKEKT